jgi:excisionase family DNA binding protein
MQAASVVSRRYISIAAAAEYLGISTKFVRNLIVEGEIKGYRIGSYARHRTIRVDLDEIDEKLMHPSACTRTIQGRSPASVETTYPCRTARPPSLGSPPRQDVLQVLRMRPPGDRFSHPRRRWAMLCLDLGKRTGRVKP